MIPKMLLRMALAASLACYILGAQAGEAIYVSVKASKQGLLKGEAVQKGFEGRIAGLGLRYEVTSPRDVVGLARGRGQHKPLILTKAWDASSPQLFQALVSNEVLPEVVIDFVGVGPMGMAAVTHSIRLVNASVTAINHYTDPDERPGRHMEDVSLSFQRIELSDTRGKTLAVDDAMGK